MILGNSIEDTLKSKLSAFVRYGLALDEKKTNSGDTAHLVVFI